MRIVIEETHKHQRLGRPVTVRVEVHVPGHELTVSHRHDTDFHVATRTAFEAMGRRLEDLMRRRRGDVKTHADAIHGGPALHAQAQALRSAETATGAQVDAPWREPSAVDVTPRLAQEAQAAADPGDRPDSARPEGAAR
jgi:hypothetical protein